MRSRFCLIAILLGGTFAACLQFGAPVLAQGQPLIMPGPCAEFGYHPVCGRSRERVLATYVNACAARSAGARVISDGACPAACPMIFKPVCAIGADGKRKTYGNDCQAMAAGAIIIRNTRCLLR